MNSSLSHGPRAAAIAAIGAIVSAGLVSGSASAAAVPTANKILIQIVCNGPDNPTGTYEIDEKWSGLSASTLYQTDYIREVTGGTQLIQDRASGWYLPPNSDGTAEIQGASMMTGPPPAPTVNDSFSWELHDLSGGDTVVANGTTSMGEVNCTAPPPPPTRPTKASFATSPSSAKVSSHRKFKFSFKAHKGLRGTVTATKNSTVLAHASFTVPSTGVEKATLQLTRKAFKKLKKVQHEKVRMTVVLKNSVGKTTDHTSLVLKAP